MSFDHKAYRKKYKALCKSNGTWNKGNVKEQNKRYNATHKDKRIRTLEYKQNKRRRRIALVKPEYAKKLLCKGTSLKYSDLPNTLVQTKQEHIKLKRMLNEQTRLVSESAG